MTCRCIMPPTALSVFCFLFLAAICGCGPARGTITGKVTYKAAKVAWGTVSVFANDNMQYSGEITAEGIYAIPNVPSGLVKICVVSSNPDAVKRNALAGREDGGIRHKGNTLRTPPVNWVAIPEKYGDPQSTTLTGTIKGDTSLDLELK